MDPMTIPNTRFAQPRVTYLGTEVLTPSCLPMAQLSLFRREMDSKPSIRTRMAASSVALIVSYPVSTVSTHFLPLPSRESFECLSN